VGSYPANAWGLHDMHGNVREWCSDRFGEYPAIRVTDPQGPHKGEVRVLRVGSWFNNSKYCRAAFRGGNDPGYCSNNNGFRVIFALDRLTLQPKQDSTSHTGDIAPDLGPEWQSWIVSNSTKEQLEEKKQKAKDQQLKPRGSASGQEINIPWGLLIPPAVTIIRKFFGG